MNRFALILGLTSAAWSGAALAQAWPQKPVRVLVGLAPGGNPDTLARILAAKWTTARLRRATISPGVRGATNTPSGAAMSNPGSTVSATVGTSGVRLDRRDMLKASTRSFPVFIALAAAG